MLDWTTARSGCYGGAHHWSQGALLVVNLESDLLVGWNGQACDWGSGSHAQNLSRGFVSPKQHVRVKELRAEGLLGRQLARKCRRVPKVRQIHLTYSQISCPLGESRVSCHFERRDMRVSSQGT